MNETSKLISNTIESIDEVSSLFYQQQYTIGYDKFQETLRLITLTIDNLFSYRDDIINENTFNEQKIVEILHSAMKAMENKDAILLSDILQYELKETLLSIQANIA